MNTIRTKSQPWKEVEVSDAGLLDLQRRDSLAKDEPAGGTSPKKRAPRKRAARKQATPAVATDENKEG